MTTAASRALRDHRIHGSSASAQTEAASGRRPAGRAGDDFPHPTERHPLISVYVDGGSEPLIHSMPPVPLKIDTRSLADGEHVLRIEASDGLGTKGVKTIPFCVRNGPEISVRG